MSDACPLDLPLPDRPGWITGAPLFALTVIGLPAPAGSKSYKGHSKAGKPILAESSKKAAPWRADIVSAVDGKLPTEWTPLDQPLRAFMVFTLARPTTAPKHRRTWPSTYPDVSKLARSTEDALKIAGVIRDDARIVDYVRLGKVYQRNPLHPEWDDPHALIGTGCVIKFWAVPS